MTLETILAYLAAAAVGWVVRHYGLLHPANATPQSLPAQGGAVLPAPVQADLQSLIQAVVSEEIKKGIAYLESRLTPVNPPTAPKPQS